MEKRRFPPRRTRQVTDIFTWVQCYATYVGVLAAKHPEAIPELMAYLICIARVSQDFAGVAWVRYDAAFRRQAAITGNRQWSRINPSLYSLCFAGRAQTSNRCDLCLSSSHATKECALVADPDPEMPSRLKAIESAVLAIANHHAPIPKPAGQTRVTTEPCRLWNNNRCTFPRCRYQHVCRGCGGAHPAVACPKQGLAGGPPTTAGPMKGADPPVQGRPRAYARPY